MPTITVSDHKIVYTVANVTITKESTYTSYNRDTKGLGEVWTGINLEDRWTAIFEVDAKKHTIKRVTGLGFPLVDGHIGHVHLKGWKYYIERGKKTVDRLFLDDWKATIVRQTPSVVTVGRVTQNVITVSINITCNASVIIDSHP